MKWLRFILSHSIFISACALALVIQTALLLHLQLSYWLYGFVFFSTLSSYNFYWALSAWALNKPSARSFLKDHTSNLLILLLASAGVLVCIIKIPGIIPLVGVACLLTLLYALPLLPVKALYFTRKAGFLKTVLLAFTWTFVTVYIPYRIDGTAYWRSAWMLFNNRFLFMLMLCIIFDTRDMQVDQLRGLRSLATDVKPATLKKIMYIIFSIYMINGIVFRIIFKEEQQLLLFLVMGIVTLAVYRFSMKKQGYFFYYFVVDGLMLLSSLLTILSAI